MNHQVYEEAENFAIESPTFSFQHPDTFRHFAQKLPSAKHALVRKIRLPTLRDSGWPRWKAMILQDLIPTFTKVRDLYIELCYGPATCWAERHVDGGPIMEMDWMRAVPALHQLPLRSAIVIIGDGMMEPCEKDHCMGEAAHRMGKQRPYRYRRVKKQEMAKYIQGRLLRLPPNSAALPDTI